MNASAQLFDFVHRHGNNNSPNNRGVSDITRTRNCHVTQDQLGLYQDSETHCTRGIGILVTHPFLKKVKADPNNSLYKIILGLGLSASLSLEIRPRYLTI